MSPIFGKKVALRPIEAGMADALYEAYAKIDEHCNFMTGNRNVPNLEKTRAFARSVENHPSDHYFAIQVINTATFIGELVFYDTEPENNYSCFRYSIYNEANRNKGYGTEALKLALQFAFEEKKFHRVDMTVFEQNERGLHIYEKLGFVKEGTYREVLLYNGKYYDGYLFGMLEDEYKESRQKGLFTI